MKIYKNPDGPNIDVLYPTLFFGSIGFIIFFLFKTCIDSDHFWGLGLAGLLSSFAIHQFLIKKKGKTFTYANLFIATTATPVMVALFLATNYFISHEIFKETSYIQSNVQYSGSQVYIVHKNQPGICPKLYRLDAHPRLSEYTYIETKINMGILGYPVVKYHKFIK